MTNACKPTVSALCGKPWDSQPTTLVTAISFKNLKKTLSQYESKFMMPSYISPYVKGNKLFFAFIFKPVDKVKDYKVEFGLDTAAMTERVQKLRKKFYVVFATSYDRNGKIYHIVVLKRKMKKSPISLLNLAESQSDYKSTSRSNRKDGYNVASMAVIQNAQGKLNYTTVYDKKSDEDTVVVCDLTFKGLLKRVNRQKNKGYTVKSIDTYTVKDETRFCAVFTNEKIGECEYIFVHSHSEKDIMDIAKNYKNDGYHIVVVAVHSQRSFPLYMAVFKK